jgi:methylated-DNA-[protein]-cysteine S-methyltransferase
MKYSILLTEIGNLRISAENGKITEIAFTDENPVKTDDPLLKKAKREICEYLDGKRKSFDLPLSVNGTAFQKAVWKAMKEIPYGETRTYGWIAEQIGKSKAVRAVGSACGKNQICIVIPCHRVTGAHGVGGYAYGVEKKKKLLEVEQNAES